MPRSITPRRTVRSTWPFMAVASAILVGLVPAVVSATSASPQPPERASDRGPMVVSPDQAASPSRLRPANLEDRPKRGVVYQGMTRAKRCPGGFLLEGTDGVCTHGPDAVGGEHGPAGTPDGAGHDHADHDHDSMPVKGSAVDVRQIPSTHELIEAAGELLPQSTSSTAGQIPCYGDGTTGPRVQMVYAVASDRTDRYAALAETFPIYAARTNAVFNNSAQATGGTRNIRFVHTADCRLDVLHVVLSPTGDDTFGNMVTELRNLGLTRTDRKYMVWADAGVYCGVASVVQDETSGATNRSNRGPTFARVDAGCWGSTNSVEAHEIAHTLGAVQLGAPNSNGAWHCADEYDRMCYNDGSGVSMRYVCPSGAEALLDCNGDDYFNVTPASGSYLATHWNLADSVFLSSTAPDSSSPPTASPSPTPTTASPSPAPTTASPTPTVTSTPTPDPSPTTSPTPTGPTKVTSTFSGSLNKKQPSRSYTVTAAAGELSSSLTYNRAKSPLTFTVIAADGTVMASASGASPVRSALSDLSGGTYTLRVEGASSASFTVTATYWQ